MKIVTQIKILPSKPEAKIIDDTLTGYIAMVNDVVSDFVDLGKLVPKTSAHIKRDIPSVLKSQAIQDARSVFKKYTKDLKAAIRFNEKNPTKKQKIVKVPVLKRPVAIWNNQNFSLEDETVSFPLWTNGKVKKTSIKAIITDRHRVLLENKLGTLRISRKRGKYIAQIAVDVSREISSGTSVMGIDLGLKIPAVAVTDTNKVKFFGNGRENKYKKKNGESQKKVPWQSQEAENSQKA